MEVKEVRCKKCGFKFHGFIPDKGKWIECPNCKNMIKVS